MQPSAARISSVERIVVVSVVIAAAAFEIWFFFFSGLLDWRRRGSLTSSHAAHTPTLHRHSPR